MKAKSIGVAAILVGLAVSVYGQCNQGGFMQKLCSIQTGNIGKMASEASVTTTFSDAIHGTTMPPSFNPPLLKDLSSLSRTDDGAFILKPGFYQIAVESYAIDGGVNPVAGFYPAPLKGAKAKAIGELLKNAELHPEIGQGDIQAVFSALVSGVGINPQQQQVAATLLSHETVQQLNIRAQTSAVANKALAWLQRRAGSNPKLQQGLGAIAGKEAGADQKYGISDSLQTFGGMATGQPTLLPAVERGTWAQMPGGFYVRYLVQSAGHTEIEIAVPDSVSGQQTFDPTQYLAVSGGSPCVRLAMSVRVPK